MTSLHKKIRTLFRRLADITREERLRPYMPIAYALVAECFEVAMLTFAALITMEAILSGFISSHISFTKILLLLFAIFTLFILLSHKLSLSFPFTPDKKSPATWIGIMWLTFILTFSTIGFPSLAIPILVGSFSAIAYLFWKILIRSDE